MPSPADTTAPRPERWDWALPHLHALLAACRPRRVLVLGRGALPPGLQAPEGSVPVTAVLHHDVLLGDLRCRPHELPFNNRAFDLLLAFDLVSDGADAGFDELLRVLDAGGRLVVLGPGRCCAPARRAGAPPVQAGPLGRSLRQRDFVIEQRAGHGLMGRAVATGSGWRRPLFALSDSVLLAARHQGHDPVVRPLRFAQPRAVGARPAMLDGVNREAAA